MVNMLLNKICIFEIFWEYKNSKNCNKNILIEYEDKIILINNYRKLY